MTHFCDPSRSRANSPVWSFVFFFNDTPTTEIYTLSLHDALPILPDLRVLRLGGDDLLVEPLSIVQAPRLDRKSTRLNSSHLGISYAVFCLKKKKKFRKNLSDRLATSLVRARPAATVLSQVMILLR